MLQIGLSLSIPKNLHETNFVKKIAIKNSNVSCNKILSIKKSLLKNMNFTEDQLMKNGRIRRKKMKILKKQKYGQS